MYHVKAMTRNLLKYNTIILDAFKMYPYANENDKIAREAFE